VRTARHLNGGGKRLEVSGVRPRRRHEGGWTRVKASRTKSDQVKASPTKMEEKIAISGKTNRPRSQRGRRPRKPRICAYSRLFPLIPAHSRV